MKKVLAWLGQLSKNPALRPLEVYALRAVLGLVAVKLGIDLEQLVK